MTSRADSTAETRQRILAAAVTEFWDSPSSDLRLESIARKSEVTVQTLLRQFGSKENLMVDAVKFESARVQKLRTPDSAESVESAIKQLVLHYEDMGDKVLRVLAEEFRTPALTPIMDIGRKFHRVWCQNVFAKTLSVLPNEDKRIRTAQLISICDVYTWKLLRQNSHLSVRATERAIFEMVNSLT